MTDNPADPTASGNRWEPTEPPPAYRPPSPPAPVAVTERRVARPGPQFWWAGGAAAAVVLVFAAGFLVGHASADDHGSPIQVERQVPQDGGRQFGDGAPPGGVPEPQG